MSQTDTILTTRVISATTSIIDIRGEFSSVAADALIEAYMQASSATTRVVVLNFTDLAYMNSSGLGLLVTLLMRANRQHQRLLCYGLSEHYQHIFMLTHLSDVIKTYATEEEALAAV